MLRPACHPERSTSFFLLSAARNCKDLGVQHPLCQKPFQGDQMVFKLALRKFFKFKKYFLSEGVKKWFTTMSSNARFMLNGISNLTSLFPLIR